MESSFKVYYSFEYEGFEDKYWSFEIPMDIFVSGVREYFSKHNIELDGKDSDIWNSFHDIDGALDGIFDQMEDWYEEKCERLAYESFKEYAISELDYEYDDEEE